MRKLAYVLTLTISLWGHSTFACPLLKQLQTSDLRSVDTEVSFHKNGETSSYRCPVAEMHLTTSDSSFRIDNFKSDYCGDETYHFGVQSFTAVVHFEGSEAVYYDHKGIRHPVAVQCSENEIYIDLHERPTTWIDPWKPGVHQWRLKLENGAIKFNWKYFTKSGPYMETSSTLN